MNPSRRDLLKSSLAAAGAAMVPPSLARAIEAAHDEAPNDSAVEGLPRERLLMDRGWRFTLGRGPAEANASANGFAKAGRLFAASDPKLDVSSWQPVDLPHDWALDLPFVNDPKLVDSGFKPLSREHPDTSEGWYRRTFTLPASDAGRRLSIEFDGAFRDCTVALNGHLLGRNLSGYAPFRVDITDVVELGKENVLVVHVDASEHEGWFYEGAGIYRHVWLVKTAPVHVPQWGTFVRADLARDSATLHVDTEVANEHTSAARCVVVSTVRDPRGTVVATTRSAPLGLGAFARDTATQTLRVANPQRWSIETPRLYTLVTTLEVNGAVVDRYETPFGLRTIAFDAQRGFFLNGERVEIRGTCNHQDHGGVGAALPDRLQAFRIERLKSMGSNAYRASHNPPTPELLDACDRLGMLVVNETRAFGSTDEALGQLERLVRRDRNRPSVIAWSIANEEPTQWNDVGERVARTMTRVVKRLDPTRPVTAAMDQAWGQGITHAVDIQGFNYRAPKTDEFHAAHPTMPVWGTEMGSTVTTRGVYANDAAKGYVSAYDVNAPWWASTAESWWSHFATRPWLLGAFVWTGFDYRGEPTPYQWPCISSHFGLIDTCGVPKDEYWYYKAWWSAEPVLHLFPHWTWTGREGQEIDVWCYSNQDRVELLLNGRSLGTQSVPRNGHVSWKVPYAPGTIEARAYRGASVALTAKRETTGAPARIVLRPDRARIAADGEDVSVVEAWIVDAEGREVPTADHAITFSVTGGRLLGVGNGDPSSHESDRGPTRRAFNGVCVAIVQSLREAGTLRVEARANGLPSANIEIACDLATLRASV